jgi:hypothetical protein
MKARIYAEKEVDLRTLHVDAGVRYWNDTEINGTADTENGDNIPCKAGNRWQPVIDLETGQIMNWEKGKSADVHYKVCDDGNYYLKDEDGIMVTSIERDYVPGILCPKERGYGDYIIMDIDENGFIQGWKADISDFISLKD